MDCNNLNGIVASNCEQSIGGIFKVFMFPFDSINQYTYTNDDLNYVTGYSTTTVPSVYKPNQLSSEYTGNKSERNYKLYDHQLVLNFLTLSKEKRDEFRKMEHMDLTVIFKDRNGRCWLMGQDVPVRLSTNQIGTGVKDAVNGYEITLVSQEKEQLKEIDCPSEGCFASFTATEARRTTFTVVDNDDYGWDYLETDVNGVLITLNLASAGQTALDPSDWNSDPAVLAQDRAVLMGLFTSAGGTVDALYTTYVADTDTTIIAIDSSDTAYGTFQVDNTVFSPSSYVSVLNLNTVVTPSLANATTLIKVVDAAGATVYQGGYGTVVGITNIIGTTNYATLVMSELYPNGTTLSIELENVPCSDVVYTYNYINTLDACTLTREFAFAKDYRTVIHVPYLVSGGVSPITQRYQNTDININGTSFQLYKKVADRHDSFTTFVNDVTLLFYQSNLPIDMGTLVFTDKGTGVDIAFNATSATKDVHYKQQVIGYNGSILKDDWIQARTVNIQTIAPLGSIVTHTDAHSHTMVGENFINITSNTFDLAYNQLGNTTVDNITIPWKFDSTVPYGANDIITTTTLGGNCNTPTLVSPFKRCYADFNSTHTGHHVQATLSAASPTSINLGNVFTIVYNVGAGNVTETFNTPSPISPNANIHYLTDVITNINGITVLHYDFDVITRKYNIHMQLALGVNLVSMESTSSGRSFTFSAKTAIYKNTTSTAINPSDELSWVLPTLLSSTATTSQSLPNGYWQMQDTETIGASATWNPATGTLSVTRAAGIDNTISIALHEVYPTTTNAKGSVSANSGFSTGTNSAIEANLITAGATLASIKYITYNNNVGWSQTQPIDMTAGGGTIEFKELTQVPIAWGTADAMNYVGSITTAQPTVVSTVTGC